MEMMRDLEWKWSLFVDRINQYRVKLFWPIIRRIRVNKVINLMREAGEEHFSMASWFIKPYQDRKYSRNTLVKEAMHMCGTTACIAGFASIAEYGNIPLGRINISAIERDAKEYLGLTGEQANVLFLANGSANIHNIPMNEAIDALEFYAKTGKVFWKKLMSTPL